MFAESWQIRYKAANFGLYEEVIAKEKPKQAGYQVKMNSHEQHHSSDAEHSALHHHHREMQGDELLIRGLIDGTEPMNATIRRISYSQGFPVWTARGTVIFAFQSNEAGWSVSGEFNDWQPYPMERTPGGLNYAEIHIPKSIGQKLAYEYVHVTGRRIADPLARCFGYDSNEEFSYLKRPSRTQYLMRWNDFKSPQGLKSRPLHVLVPPNSGPYDVLYAHDGQNLFAPDSICGGWHLCENMQEINGNFLIVGIWNCEDRMSEYTHAADTDEDGYHATLGRKYASFIENSVRPFIEYQFPTTQRAGLMGSSLGGLISLYISNCYPGRYDSVFALSPTTAWGRFGSDHGTLIRDYYEKAGHQNTFLYIDHGGEFPTEGMPDVLDQKVAIRDESEWASAYDNCCYTFDFVSALVEIGYRQSVDMFYQHVHGALHNEVAWASRVAKPLTLFMNHR